MARIHSRLPFSPLSDRILDRLRSGAEPGKGACSGRFHKGLSSFPSVELSRKVGLTYSSRLQKKCFGPVNKVYGACR